MESSCEFENLFICYGLRTSGTINRDLTEEYVRKVQEESQGDKE